MQRLLQGDVGCGKTIVAALAACQAIEAGHQAAFMAPTEILAEQNHLKLRTWLAPLGIEVVCLSGGLSKGIRRAKQVPVSYTHLDVYKRQPFISRDRSASTRTACRWSTG